MTPIPLLRCSRALTSVRWRLPSVSISTPRVGPPLTLLAWVACALCGQSLRADDPPLAAFQVSDKVVQSQPLRFGAVFRPGRFKPTTCWIALNQWAPEASFEPPLAVAQGLATSGSDTELVDTQIDGLARNGLALPGFWDGAEVTIYRADDERGFRLLRSGAVKSSLASDGERVDTLTLDDGPAIRPSDFYQIRQLNPDFNRLRKPPKPAFRYGAPARFHEEFGAIQLARDTARPAPCGGVASLQVHLTERSLLGLRAEWIMNADMAEWMRRIPEGGTEWLVRVWLRQENLADNKLTLIVGDWSESFPVSDEWREFEFKVPIVAPRSLGKFGVFGKGPGTFWIDGLRIEQPEMAFLEPHREWFERLRAYRPSVLRLDSHPDGAEGQTLDNWIAGEFEARGALIGLELERSPSALNLHSALALCEQVGADPYFTISPMMTESEWGHLMDYLGSDSDRAPYAAKRVAAGRDRPWTDSFQRFYLEIGDDEWLERRPGFQGRPELYARWVAMIERTLRESSSPAANKVRLIASGPLQADNPWNVAIRKWTQTAATGHSVLTPGAWFDSPDDLTDTAPEIGLQRLFLGERLFQPSLESVADEARGRALAFPELGPDYRPLHSIHDADPLGERAGKSMATAVALLDLALEASARGVEPICFQGFDAGLRWTSHSRTPEARPQAPFLAFQLRNLHCDGDLMAVRPILNPTLDVPPADLKLVRVRSEEVWSAPALPNAPVVKVFAFRGPEHWSILALSRAVTNTVALRVDLPFEPETEGRQFLLTSSNHLAHNLLDESVTLRESALQCRRAIETELPPHSVVVVQVRPAPSGGASHRTAPHPRDPARSAKRTMSPSTK